MNGLLSCAGAHPALLDDPYYSSCETFDDWLAYLKWGLAAFDRLLVAKAKDESEAIGCTLL